MHIRAKPSTGVTKTRPAPSSIHPSSSAVTDLDPFGCSVSSFGHLSARFILQSSSISCQSITSAQLILPHSSPVIKKKNPHDPGLPLQAEFESILGLNREANITCKLGPVLDHPQAKRTGARTRAISGFGSSRSLIYSNTKIAQIHSKSPSWMDFVHLHKSIGTFILSIASLSSCSSSR